MSDETTPTTAPAPASETATATAESNVTVAMPNTMWKKLDRFMYGRGQEILAGFLIAFLLFWTVIGTITNTRVSRLEKQVTKLISELDSARTQIGAWGENTDKVVDLLDGTRTAIQGMKDQHTILVDALTSNTEATGQTQGAIAGLSDGVQAMSDSNKEIAKSVRDGITELGKKVDNVKCTVIFRSGSASADVPKPAVSDAGNKDKAGANEKDDDKPDKPTPEKRGFLSRLWPF